MKFIDKSNIKNLLINYRAKKERKPVELEKSRCTEVNIDWRRVNERFYCQWFEPNIKFYLPIYISINRLFISIHIDLSGMLETKDLC